MAGIYLHIPFCKKACTYCNFHFSTSFKHQENVLAAIVQELKQRAASFNYPVETIYFGGGTPSILNENQLSLFFKVLEKHYDITSSPEITLEANPDDLNSEKIKLLKKTGVNRLSIGIQSFKTEDLQFMNRTHTAQEAESAIKRSQDTGIENISVDLIYGTPTLTNSDWLVNLKKITALEVTHLSAYALTVEPKTALFHQVHTTKKVIMDEEKSLEQFELLMDFAPQNGFEQYEISNFSKKGFISRHNSAYWLDKPYLGVGPSAHSFQDNTRRWNLSNNLNYVNKINNQAVYFEQEHLTDKDLYNEKIFLKLRTKWGLSLDELPNDTFKNFFIKNVEKFIQQQLINHEKDTFTLTTKGKTLADYIAQELFYVE
ncbi:MAG: radical SAM family heme chaperone HemW [Vicingaceae bacterium]